jgi:glutathione S-transferase
MNLYLNQASPYARLINVLLVETGLDSETELIFVDPWESPDELLVASPASKVPALTLKDGTQLVESACIGDYLIQRSGRSALSPMSHPDAETRLRILGLGRAAIDCSFGSVIQQRFAPDSPLIERWRATLPRIAGALEQHYAGKTSTDADLADLTVAVAFEYIDFRLPEIQWQSQAPHLAERVSSLGQRTSLETTRPH